MPYDAVGLSQTKVGVVAAAVTAVGGIPIVPACGHENWLRLAPPVLVPGGELVAAPILEQAYGLLPRHVAVVASLALVEQPQVSVVDCIPQGGEELPPTLEARKGVHHIVVGHIVVAE